MAFCATKEIGAAIDDGTIQVDDLEEIARIAEKLHLSWIRKKGVTAGRTKRESWHRARNNALAEFLRSRPTLLPDEAEEDVEADIQPLLGRRPMTYCATSKINEKILRETKDFVSGFDDDDQVHDDFKTMSLEDFTDVWRESLDLYYDEKETEELNNFRCNQGLIRNYLEKNCFDQLEDEIPTVRDLADNTGLSEDKIRETIQEADRERPIRIRKFENGWYYGIIRDIILNERINENN